MKLDRKRVQDIHKRVRVTLKLYARTLKRSPYLAAVSAMALVTFGLTSFVAYHSFMESGKYATSTFSKWSHFQKAHAKRSIASSSSPVCQHDRVDRAVIDREITELETQYETGHFIEGNWYGVNLKGLPSIQAQMLADHGHLVGNKNRAKTYKGCQDAVCVFNKIYEDSTGMAGKIVYYWYLKTGSMISLTNEVPGQKSQKAGHYQGAQHPYDSFLFTKHELKQLYFLAKSLPTSFAHNPLFKSLHKLPNVGSVEGRQECAASLPSGQVLIGPQCLGGNSKAFMTSIGKQIAKYVDQYHALNEEKKLYSQTQEWLNTSLWLKEEIWDQRNQEYKYVWRAHSDSNFIASGGSPSPGEQLSTMLSQYRFNPERFKNKVAPDVANTLKHDFFSGESYDASGLFSQYLEQSVDEWTKREANLWQDCVEEHYDPEKLQSNSRDIASSLENPLFSCVEKKIPHFEKEMIESIQRKNAQGCAFFNDSINYGHVAKRYREAMNKFLMEKILQRKIELKRHGEEVLAGQKAKQEFINQVDPTTVFINCHGKDDAKTCYEKTIETQLTKVLNGHREISDYYRKVVKEDILSLFAFEDIQLRTREIAKKFIAPFYSQVHFASKHIWESCKAKGADESRTVKLPLQFTGGRHFVNAKLLNCVNEKMDEELYEIVSLGAFQKTPEQKIEFRLNEVEKEFALTFMKGKMRQILNNILEDEVKLEKAKLASYFKENETDMLKVIKGSDLMDEIYSFSQVEDKCLEVLSEHYPENFYYHPKSKVDKQYGRTICSSYIEHPDNAKDVMAKVNEKWEANKKVAVEYLDEEFEDLAEDCHDDFSNPRMLQICVEEAYKTAVTEAVLEWRDEDEYEYFSQNENELINHMYSIGRAKINKALQ